MADILELEEQSANKSARRFTDKQKIMIGLLVVASFVFLFVVRLVLVTPLDTAITRFGCENHSAYLNDLDNPDRVEESPVLDERNSDEVKFLVSEGVTWQVEGSVRSNKLGLLNRSDAECIYSTNFDGAADVAISYDLVSHGIFYPFGKFLGIMLQIGLLSGFFRWSHDRFFAND